MQQIMIQTAKASQQMAEEAQRQQEAEEQAFMERFDTNHDGKITGKEKGPAKKYLRQKELGLDPDAKIKNQKQATMKLGKTRRTSKSTKSTKSTKSAKSSKESKEIKDSDDSKESTDEKDSKKPTDS